MCAFTIKELEDGTILVSVHLYTRDDSFLTALCRRERERKGEGGSERSSVNT